MRSFSLPKTPGSGSPRILALAALLIALTITAAWAYQDGRAAPEATAAAPTRSFTDWRQYLGGSDSSQYSALSQINRSNVSQLEVVWTYPTADERQYLFNPIVIDGTMYVQARDNSLVALDASTGRELWVHPFEGPVTTRGINFWSSADGSDRRLITTNGGYLTAINAATGETILSFGDNGRADLRWGFDDRDLSATPPIQTNNPGRIFEDLIIMPTMRAGADYAYLPGDIHAYSVVTGQVQWVFHTVPRPGEFGYDTWPEGIWRYAGGALNWNALSIDEARGVAYIPLGTAKFDYYGGNRHGANLYGNSVIALNARTGERIWHYQTVHHDLWDYDLPAAPKLLTVRHDGAMVDVVAQPTKHGFLFVLNRDTGEPLWPVEERPVPASDMPGEEAWPTQPFPTRPAPYARQSFSPDEINPFLPEEEQADLRERMASMRNEGLFTPPSFEGTVTLPSTGGGASWGTAAVDPAAGLLYIVSHDTPVRIRLADPADPTAKGRPRIAEPAAPGAPDTFVHYMEVVNDFTSPSTRLPVIEPPWSTMTAYDLNTGATLWRVPYGTVNALADRTDENTGVVTQRGGPVATAGGLLFAATNDKKFRAYDRDTGVIVWETDLPSAAEGVPAVYELNGREYIALCVAAATPGFAGAEPERLPGSYMVFALPD